MKLYNSFVGGVMNKDLEIRLLPKNILLDAKNVRIVTNDSNNSRSVKPLLGTTVKTALSLGDNAETVGTALDTFRNKIYWAVASDSGSYICEYDVANETENIVLSDTRSGSSNLFGFSSGDYVDMRVLNDNDNGKNYITFTSSSSDEPKYFEIEAGKALTDSSFVLEDVSLIKSSPTTAPTLSLQTGSGQNNLESKFISFAYRYKYQNGEWSALSPFSEFAFQPSGFSYNYKSGTNSAMFNAFSSVDIDINTGSSNVSDVQLIMKESGSNTGYIVETYNKSGNSWSDDTSETVSFNNSRVYAALDPNQLSRVYDNVPINAATVEIIGNRLVFGNYTEGYDIEYQDSAITPNFALDYVSASGTSGNVHEQVKTNRDYEIAIAYTDGRGRQTTPITAPANTTYVPYSVANEKVQLRLTINSGMRPPDWATGYKLYLKQSKVDYDTIAPITFYRDGIFAWIKLEGNDSQKVKEGDFIFVKSDTATLQSIPVRTKVLEVKNQEVNFLEGTVPDPYEVLQEAGNYMRIEVDGYNISTNAVRVEEWVGYGFRSKSTNNNLDPSGVTYTEGPFFEGTGLDDMTNGGSLTGNADIRFEIEIDGTSSPNTFRWRSWDVSADPNNDGYGSWTSTVAITGSAQTLSNGITVTFGATTGHTIGDKWFLSAKAGARVEDWDNDFGGAVSGDGRRAIVLLQSKDPTGDESIRAGASIVITYDDTASDSSGGAIGYKRVSLSSSKNYANLEEWFYGDAIYNDTDFLDIVPDSNDVLFRRGTLDKSNGEEMTVTNSLTDRMYMAFLSPVNYTGSNALRIDNSLSITEFENNIIFETIPTDNTTDIFYELPYTYSVAGGVHLSGGGTDQVFGSVNAVITLDYFNCFGWYNGFESYKIGDTFNEKTMVLDTKPLVPVDGYQQTKRIASLTYSDVYESTTQVNALNEFNLAEVNYKDMDIKYGAIKLLHSEDTNLDVYQQDKTHKVLFGKSVLFNADGTGNVTQSLNVLGQEIAYGGEYGIGDHPESWAVFGNRRYHLDKDRGVLLRLSVDGYTEISQKGMHDYFRTLPSQSLFVGGYDPYFDEYLINVNSSNTLGFSERATEGGGFTSFYEYQPERLVGINNRLYGFKSGQIWLHDSSSTRNTFYGDARSAQIRTVFNDQPQDVKTFRSMNLESDSSSWSVVLSTNFTNGTIATTEWSEEEGEYYAYLRQGEDISDNEALTTPLNVYAGIGEVASYATNTATFSAGVQIPRALGVGDSLYRYDGTSSFDLIGTITAYTTDSDTGVTITVGSTSNTPTAGQLIIVAKNARIEGEAIKGYYLDATLTNSLTTEHELFAIKVEASRSSD